ncbi:MAG: TetR/AcrR family transcriptional regulator [Pseudomonadota bacterium]|nr:TetR/AcrR family transcriptional regulator [Pseudomonadota bacterium]
MDKQQQLITTAFRLFYRNGIHATGINQILKEAGVAKKTLYHHFPGKDDLLLAVLNYRDQRFTGWMMKALEQATDAETLCDAWFMALDDWFNSRAEELLPFRGCFFIHTAAEYSDPAHPVHQQCQRHKQQLQQALQQRLSTCLDDRRATELARSWALLKEGAITSAAVGGDLSAARQALTIARHSLGS